MEAIVQDAIAQARIKEKERQAAKGADSGDNVYETYVLRPISSRITPLFVWAEMSPNEVTLLSFFCGIFAALAFAIGNPISGGLLYVLSFVLDLCDGEVARITNKVTPKGAWIDNSLDQVKDGVVLFGMIGSMVHMDMANFGGAVTLAFFAFISVAQYNLSTYLRKLYAPMGVSGKRNWKTALLPSGAQRVLLTAVFVIAGQIPALLIMFIVHYNVSWLRIAFKKW